MNLPGGLVLRTAMPADLDQIGALLTERGDAVDAVDHRLVVADEDAGWSSCAVVVDGDRVVSTATLLDETLWLGGVEIKAVRWNSWPPTARTRGADWCGR